MGSGGLRIAVAAVIGGFGTLSMVTSPITWLINGGSVPRFFAEATAWDLGFTALRAAHVAVVLAALALMFTSESHRFFTARGRLHEDTVSAKSL